MPPPAPRLLRVEVAHHGPDTAPKRRWGEPYFVAVLWTPQGVVEVGPLTGHDLGLYQRFQRLALAAGVAYRHRPAEARPAAEGRANWHQHVAEALEAGRPRSDGTTNREETTP